MSRVLRGIPGKVRWGALGLAVLLVLSGGWYLAANGAYLWGPRPLLKTAARTSMQYYLSLPAGWTPARTWPILVTIDGSEHDFQHNCQSFMQARQATPFIIVTPLVVSNAGQPTPADYTYAPPVWAAIARLGAAAWDEQGLRAVVQEVQQDYHGQAKFFLTGWSAGGHLTWQMIFTHPELLAGAAPTAANYQGRGITTISAAPERALLAVRAFQGDGDPGLDALTDQWTQAVATAQAHGYTRVARTIVPGRGHSPFPTEVLAFFTTLLGP